MSSPIDNDDWCLSAYMDWKPSKSYVVCECCNGKGKVGGGFKDMEGPRDCDRCSGTGRHGFYPKSVKPEIPKELMEHMRKAWITYWESRC
jgi:DnaJ-class molecular chaperone